MQTLRNYNFTLSADNIYSTPQTTRMLPKQILLPLFVLSFMLEDCNKLAKCKRYVGDYNHNGQLVSIKYDGVHFSMEKQGQLITCTCTDDGVLTIKDTSEEKALILNQDSDGTKSVCIDASEKGRDCMQKR